MTIWYNPDGRKKPHERGTDGNCARVRALTAPQRAFRRGSGKTDAVVLRNRDSRYPAVNCEMMRNMVLYDWNNE